MQTIEWIVTTKCNYKCDYCWVDNKDLIETDVSDELISIVYDKLKDLSIKDNIRLIIHGGEPLLCFKLIEICHKFSDICSDIKVNSLPILDIKKDD